jgi:hypothetical protein
MAPEKQLRRMKSQKGSPSLERLTRRTRRRRRTFSAAIASWSREDPETEGVERRWTTK